MPAHERLKGVMERDLTVDLHFAGIARQNDARNSFLGAFESAYHHDRG